MTIREAANDDITQMQEVRHSVKENRLSNPNLVTDNDCRKYINERGKGWVCETENKIVAFAIADLKDDNIWALFVRPEYENKGIGKKLYTLMMNWYFGHEKNKAWLSTGIGTRAEIFYKSNGWTETGLYGKKEIKLEMTYDKWKEILKEKPYIFKN